MGSSNQQKKNVLHKNLMILFWTLFKRFADVIDFGRQMRTEE